MNLLLYLKKKKKEKTQIETPTSFHILSANVFGNTFASIVWSVSLHLCKLGKQETLIMNFLSVVSYLMYWILLC